MAPATNGKGSRGLRYMKQHGGEAPVCAGSGDECPTTLPKLRCVKKQKFVQKSYKRRNELLSPQVLPTRYLMIRLKP
jgi:hypothetical protein